MMEKHVLTGSLFLVTLGYFTILFSGREIPKRYFLIRENKKASILRISFSNLKVQSCKSYNNKYMIALTQITNSEIFVIIAVLVYKLLSRKVLFIKRKENRNC